MIHWKCTPFNELTAAELYSIMQLRSEVFVVEQHCVYLDADGKDALCHHLTGTVDGVLVAYARLLPPGVSYGEMSIGRVVTSPRHRRIGAGKALMGAAINQCDACFGKGPIKIGAQQYLEHFYESFGFRQCGPVYDEDGIPHIPMVREGK